MAEWHNDLMLSFLEMYQREPVLWDRTHAYHKDKKRVNDAWSRISESMGCTVSELKKKKDSLMATFRGHLRKKKAAMRSGAGIDDAYKPVWFAYEFMETFLAPVYDYNPTIHSSQSQMLLDSDENPDDRSASQTLPSTGDFQNTSSSSAVVQPTNCHCNNPLELQETRRLMKQAFTMFNNVVAEKANAKEEDECDLFGKMVAKKLQKVPENERDMIMYEIDGIFIRRNCHNLSTSVLSPTNIQNRSPSIFSDENI